MITGSILVESLKVLKICASISLLFCYLASCLCLYICTLKNRTNIYYVTLLKFVIAGPLLRRVTKVLLLFHLLQVRVLARHLHKAPQSPLLRPTVPRVPTQLVIEVFATVVVSQATSADTAFLIFVISKLVR